MTRSIRAVSVSALMLVGGVGAVAAWAPGAAAQQAVHIQGGSTSTTVVGDASGDAPLPSVATEGTTSSNAKPTDDPAQDRLRYVIWGLVALAILVSIVTVLLWRATSPARTVTVTAAERPSIPGSGRTTAVSDRAPLRPAVPAPLGGQAAPGSRPHAVDPLMAPTTPLPPEA